MISSTRLDQGKIATSGNMYLQSVVSLVGMYNNLARGSDTKTKADILEGLMFRIGYWITSHPPKQTTTNLARWKAMRELTEDIGSEMETLGVRGLTGPTNWKKIGEPINRSSNPPVRTGKDRSYWLEYLDPFHRPGFVLAGEFEKWITQGGADQDFWDYAGTPTPFVDMQVKYLGGVSAKGLKRLVEFSADRNLRSLHPTRPGEFMTRDLETCFSGDGWCIFVADLDGRIFAHRHVEGMYHHSTFLSGAPVLAAGEMVVDDGKVRVITAKSGHYKPSLANLTAFVRTFPWIPGDAIIRPNLMDERTYGHVRFYRIRQFRFEGENAPVIKQADLAGVVPQWARNNKSNAWLSHVPA